MSHRDIVAVPFDISASTEKVMVIGPSRIGSKDEVLGPPLLGALMGMPIDEIRDRMLADPPRPRLRRPDPRPPDRPPPARPRRPPLQTGQGDQTRLGRGPRDARRGRRVEREFVDAHGKKDLDSLLALLKDLNAVLESSA
jgi:hypothetical protein